MREIGLGLALLGTASLGASASGGGHDLHVQILDEFTSPASQPKSIESVANAPFRTFIDATLASLNRSAKFGDGEARPRLRFVRVALATSGDDSRPVSDYRVERTAGACAVKSPWIDAVVSPETGAIDGTAHWNERQVLLDHARLDGANAAARTPVRALSRSEFEAEAEAYAQREIVGAGGREAKDQSAELLWLFRRAPQSTFAPFSGFAEDTMQEIAADSARAYGELVGALLLHCQKSGADEIVVNDIHEAEQLLSLNFHEIFN
jgi:hypothetical protein